MKTSDFDFYLPDELIAQTPLERRDASRLLTLDRHTGQTGHFHFFDLPQFLRPGDCLVLNNSRVLPARLIGHRPTGGVCEVLLLTDKGDNQWECLVRPGRKLRPGAQVIFGQGQLTASIEAELPDGKRLVRFHYQGIFLEILEALGKMPLPPYIKAELEDNERYQTVYSKVMGSAAAPTAAFRRISSIAFLLCSRKRTLSRKHWKTGKMSFEYRTVFRQCQDILSIARKGGIIQISFQHRSSFIRKNNSFPTKSVSIAENARQQNRKEDNPMSSSFLSYPCR